MCVVCVVCAVCAVCTVSTHNANRQCVPFVSFVSFVPFVLCIHTTARLTIPETHTKNYLANEPEGLRQVLDHRWKALGEENSDLLGPFLFRVLMMVIWGAQNHLGMPQKSITKSSD